MSNTDTIDIAHIKFSSTACPSEEDIRLWDSLSADEQHAVLERDLLEAEKSDFALPESLDERLARVRTKN